MSLPKKTARGGETPGPGRDHDRPFTCSRKTTKMQTYSSYVVVAGTEYAVDTLDQIAVAEAALVDAGEESAPVWTGGASADEENNAEAWWTAARAAKETAPAWLRPLLDVSGPNRVLAPDAAAAKAGRAWAEDLPGYSDGPDYARTALIWR